MLIKYEKSKNANRVDSFIWHLRVDDLDCIMTLEVFETFSCNGWLVMWVHYWPLVQGTGVQISLEPFLSARLASASASISPFFRPCVRPTLNLNFITYIINDCVNSYLIGY